MKLVHTWWVQELVWTFWQRTHLASFTIQIVDHPPCNIVTILTALPAPFHSLRERKCNVLSKYNNITLSQDGTHLQIRAVAYFPTFIHCDPEEPHPCLIYSLFHALSVIKILRPKKDIFVSHFVWNVFIGWYWSQSLCHLSWTFLASCLYRVLHHFALGPLYVMAGHIMFAAIPICCE